MPFVLLYQAVELLLENCRMCVFVGDSICTWLRQVTGLPQGSILSLTLFNLCTSDFPATVGRRFTYVDDICCLTRAGTFAETECRMTADLPHLAKCGQLWYLEPSTSRRVTRILNLLSCSEGRLVNVVSTTQKAGTG